MVFELFGTLNFLFESCCLPLLVSVDKKLHSMLYISIQLCEINGYHMGTTKADPGFLKGGGADLIE